MAAFAPVHFGVAGRLRHTKIRRGSVLIVALVIAAVIALGLASFLSLNLTSSRLAKRTVQGYVGLNLAEAGVEEGTWSMNRAAGGDRNAWSGWAQNGGAAWKKFNDFSFSQGATGWVKVYVSSSAPSTATQPKIISYASIAGSGEAPVTKMLEVSLRRRSYFAQGVVAVETLAFHGNNTSVDSWNSDPDHDPATPPVDYSPAVRIDHGTLASPSRARDAVMVDQAQVWGYVSTGGAPPRVVGPNGNIRGTTTANGVVVDPARVTTDFNADFPLIPLPADGTPIATIGATLGTFGQVTRWRCQSLSLHGNDTLTIQGDVTLIITASSGNQGVSITGNAALIIPAGSRLTIYLESDLLIAGQGLANDNVQAGTCTIWGANQTQGGQRLHIAGRGALRSAIYAPNADVQVNGNGDVMGSIVARNILFNGNAAFHFDESLAETGGNTPFGIGQWRELTTADEQSPYLSLFNGW
jgi:hypothetical protein